MQKKPGDRVFVKSSPVSERKALMRIRVIFAAKYLHNELTALCVTNAIQHRDARQVNPFFDSEAVKYMTDFKQWRPRKFFSRVHNVAHRVGINVIHAHDQRLCRNGRLPASASF